MATNKPRTYKGHKIIDGLAYNTVLTRVNDKGWDVEEACTTPPMPLSDAARRSGTPWRNKGAVGYFASMETRYGKK